jgi:hypothetical protein
MHFFLYDLQNAHLRPPQCLCVSVVNTNERSPERGLSRQTCEARVTRAFLSL